MPLQATSGAASYDAFGGGVAAVPNYIEDVFSTWLFTGDGSSQTIVNGIDLSTKGGLVWQKIRGVSAGAHILTDTARGVGNYLMTNSTDPQYSGSGAQAFNINGFGSTPYGSGANIASWTFREQPKFFDVVTYTRDSSAYQTITHNLGSTPGCIIVKSTSGSSNWAVYHRSIPTGYLTLNSTNANIDGLGFFQNVTSTSFETSIGAAGVTYVAYLFAHNAGGFGLTGTDNVISCGSFSMPAGGGDVSVDLGYEPQWVLLKDAKHSGNDWWILDTMRGYSAQKTGGSLTGSTGGEMRSLWANLSSSEGQYNYGGLTATGFKWPSNFNYADGNTDYIYIAIRRGPMKVPTTGTKVLAAVTRSGNSTQTIVTGASSPPDLVMVKSRNNATELAFTDRLRGVTRELSPAYNFSEDDYGANPTVSINMNGWTAPAGYGTFNQSGYTYIDYMFSRYPNVFDEVCYTSNYSGNPAVNHNLGVIPELLIFKDRGAPGRDWEVYCPSVIGSTNMLPFNRDYSVQDVGTATTLTSTTFQQQSVQWPNAKPYVAYLFATLAGVSKVGSYTGTGASQVINCGFTTGARWVMIKRTDSTGNWYVWDTARGMVSGTDPFLIMNDTLAETNANYIFTSSTGFTIQSGVPAAINANGGTFLFLAIA